MDNMQGFEDHSNSEQKQIEEVHKCITSTKTGNCAAANNSSAHISEEGVIPVLHFMNHVILANDIITY
jgi:hypothetical protein